MRRQLLVLSLWLRVAIYVAVWLLVFLPGRGTIVVVSGAAISYSAARRGYGLGCRVLRIARQPAADFLGTGWHEVPQAGDAHQAFAAGYDLYSPSEKRWIIGGTHLSYPTGDALFDYLHSSLPQDRGPQPNRIDRSGAKDAGSKAPE